MSFRFADEQRFWSETGHAVVGLGVELDGIR
jgi:hypothetical protein